MSNSDAVVRDIFPFQVTIPSPDVKIIVFDGYGHAVAEEYGKRSYHLSLPRGLYTVRMERAGFMKEILIRHDGPTKKTLEIPGYYTATPLAMAASTKDYYMEASQRFSLETTCSSPGKAPSPDAWMFIFIRASSRELFTGDHLGSRLYLLNQESKPISALCGPEVVFDQNAGWLAFSARMHSGLYLLRFQGKNARELPLYLFSNWQTQVFLTHYDRPIFDGMRIFLSPLGTGFNPEDETTRLVDQAQTLLHNRSSFVPQAIQLPLRAGLFDDPMLGLVGVHLLQFLSSTTLIDTDKALHRLNELLPDAPDVRALPLLTAPERISSIAPFSQPPMLRRSLEAVVDTAVNSPSLIPYSSLFGQIVTKQYADAPWSSWDPSKTLSQEGASRIYFIQKARSPQKSSGRVGDASAPDIASQVDVLSQATTDPKIRRAAAVALGKLGDARAVPELIKALNDPDDKVRRSTVVALGRIGDPRALNPLSKALDDENEQVRQSASVALRKMGKILPMDWVQVALIDLLTSLYKNNRTPTLQGISQNLRLPSWVISSTLRSMLRLLDKPQGMFLDQWASVSQDEQWTQALTAYVYALLEQAEEY